MLKQLLMKIYFLHSIFWVLVFNYSFAQNSLPIVPKPAEENSIATGPAFILNTQSTIFYNNTILKKDVQYFQQKLLVLYNLKINAQLLPAKNKIPQSGNAIFVEMGPKNWQSGKGEAYYHINAIANSIHITVQHSKGFFYSIQSILQCIQKTNSVNEIKIPAMLFADYPRFIYRGMHLDVARHFMPIEVVKNYIDYLALYKFNTFHWHLTDDQGWRIEIKKYPLLTSIGGFRNGTVIGPYPGIGNDSIVHGGFYTQQQIKEIVAYAAARYITVIPEIEMPGHASAAIAAYPQLSCFPNQSTQYPKECVWAGNNKGKQVQQTWGVFEDVFCPSPYTFNFLQNVIDEIVTLFPAPYIHIGGDECTKEAWKKSAFCQQLIATNHLKDEHGLQSYFINKMEKYINKKGKKIIGWDEILEGGLAPNATVMSWRGEEGGIAAAKLHHYVIMTPESNCYFDHSQNKQEDSVTIGGYLPIEEVYNYEPIPAALNAKQAAYVLGAQANVWTEYITNKSKLQYMIFPRIAALAEVLWTPREKRNWQSFKLRLPYLLAYYKTNNIQYGAALLK